MLSNGALEKSVLLPQGMADVEELGLFTGGRGASVGEQNRARKVPDGCDC